MVLANKIKLFLGIVVIGIGFIMCESPIDGLNYEKNNPIHVKGGIIQLKTSDVTEIGVSFAVVGGSINGGSEITERGIVYSESSNPTTSNFKISSSGTKGEFTVNLTGLKSNSTYYARSYAINWVGTSYGNQVSFTTLLPPFTNSIGIEFVYIKPGSFYMGSTVGDSDEQAVHKVTLTKGFYMGKYEVTQKQWVEIMGSNPSYSRSGIGSNYPVNQVSWNDIHSFITKLNEKEGGTKYRLPTEAEWEYSAQAGTAANGEGPKWNFGNDEAQLPNYAWYSSNSDTSSHEVGNKLPNQYDLYDMHGNVYEWVEDWYGSYSSGSLTDPKGPKSGTYRVIRGGSWNYSATRARSANRSGYEPEFGGISIGFRLLRLLK